MFGDHDAISFVTAVAPTSPPAPSPPAASVKGRPGGGLVPVRGRKMPGAGGEPAFAIFTGNVITGVVTAPTPVAETPSVCAPFAYRVVGHRKLYGGSNATRSRPPSSV